MEISSLVEILSLMKKMHEIGVLNKTIMILLPSMKKNNK